MICFNCGKEVPDGASFCRYCGSPLKSAQDVNQNKQDINEVVEPIQQYDIPSVEQYPINNYDNSNDQDNKQTEPPKKSKLPLFISIAVLIIAIAGVGVYFMPKMLGNMLGNTEEVSESSTEETDEPEEVKNTDDAVKEENQTKDTESKEQAEPDFGSIDNDEINDAEVSDDSACEELSAIIVEMEEKVAALDISEEDLDDLGKTMQIVSDLYDDLLAAEERALSIEGLEDKERDAAKIMFETYKVAIENFYAVVAIADGLMGYCAHYVEEIPSFSYDDSDCYYAYSEWYEKQAELYKQVSYTDAYNDILARIENNLEHCAYIEDKVATSINSYYDPLRLVSADNLKNRGVVEISNILDDISKRFEQQITYAEDVEKTGEQFENELVAYLAMSESDREAYEFDFSVINELSTINYDVVDTIYPALYGSYDSIMIINTGCVYGNRNIVVEAEIPGLTQKFKQSYTILPEFTTVCVKPPVLSDADVYSAKDSMMQVSIYEADGITLIESKSFPVKIKSVNDVEWSTTEFGTFTMDNILCYLTPEADGVKELKRAAVNSLNTLTSGNMQSIMGYQGAIYSGDFGYSVTTACQAAALQVAMCDLGIRYVTDGYSESGSNQHVLLPNQVVSSKQGLCIETSLLTASALQSAGFHCFLVFPPGHAKVAVETEPNSGYYLYLETTVLNDNLSTDDYVDYLNGLLDGERIPDTNTTVEYINHDEWIDQIANGEITYLIDCDDSAIFGHTPFAK